MEKKVLIISYQFCPKGQIGTRRWSKFAKYLSRSGYTVFVLCSKYPYRDEINWCHEVEDDPNIRIHRLAARYPAYVLQPVRTFGVKLLDRILSRSLYYFDNAQFWGAVMRPAARKLIREEGIRNVIVTGPPFSPLYQAARIKKGLPDIRLIFDFRDPLSQWISTETLLGKLRNWVGNRREASALAAADKILLTTQTLTQEYGATYPSIRDRMHVLYNGYDEDDFQELPEQTEIKQFQFVYTGLITKAGSLSLEYLIRTIADMEDDFFAENMRINIYGYGYNPPQFQEESLRRLSEQIVHYRGVVPQSEVYSVIQQHEFCLAILAPERSNVIAVKTFDYMRLGKKIFIISPPGELSDILVRNGQYVATYDKESIRAALLAMKEDHLQGKMTATYKDLKDFEYGHLTERLISFMG